MTKRLLGLFVLAMAVAAGCSKSSADGSANRKPVGSAAAAAPGSPAPAGSSAPEPAKPAVAGVSADDACDDACTNFAICYERFYEGDNFRDGGGCVDNCKEMSAAAQAEWAAAVADALRTNQCARLFEEETAASAEGTATLQAGELRMGCFAWSERSNAAACVTGVRGSTDTRLQLSFVGGGDAAIKLVESEGDDAEIDATLAGTAASVLAKDGFNPIAGAASRVVAGTPRKVNGVSITLTSVMTNRGGENVGPTYANRVVAKCAGRTLELFRDDAKRDGASVVVRPVGAHALVEITSSIHQEGEYVDELHAVLVEARSCKVTKSST